MNNNNIILKFTFEEIVNNRQQQQGWYELLLRPYQNGLRIPTLEYLDSLSEQEKLDLDIQVFRSLSEVEKKYDFERLSVNIFADSLKSPYFRNMVMDSILTHRINPTKYCIEIKDSPNQNFDGNVINFLNLLRERCTLIALNEFGTGTTHWDLIQHGVIDVIKVANQKMNQLSILKNNYIQALYQFADTMNLTTILEGIEEQNGFVIGRAMGFKHFQGWLFDNTMEEHAIEVCV